MKANLVTVLSIIVLVIVFTFTSVPAIFGGALITEQIFRIPGIGLLLINAIEQSDTPVVMGATLMFSVLVVLFNIVADLLYGVLDPRIRYD